MLRRLLLPLLVAAGVASAVVVAPAQGAATSMRLGFLDGGFSDARVQGERFGEAVALGSRVARVPTGWPGIAPTRPARPTDPADPAYRWDATDAAVRGAVAAGVEPLLSLTQAPTWAEGPGRPRETTILAGAWRPDPVAYGLFAQALATRYDGRYPDPKRPGATLPRVRVFIPWNEPNLDRYLAPQWRRTSSGLRIDAAIRYRQLVRRFHDGVKVAQPGALVVAGALGPFGDPQPGGARLSPARFLREMLCLTTSLRRRACGAAGTPRFDVLSHHPYSVGGPFRRALNRDDVSVPDMGKLTRPLRRAERLGLLGSKRARRVWVTEIAWDSAPADPDGVPSGRHADWLAQSLYVLARQGVDTVTWFQVRDQPPGDGGFGRSSQSGVLTASGRSKAAATAFRFPLAAVRRGRRTTVWTLAPGSGPLVIERRAGSRWVRVTGRTVGRGRVVSRVTRLAAGTQVRARQGAAVSRTVRVSVERG